MNPRGTLATMPNRRAPVAKAEPYTRSLEEQCADSTGARRRADHPRAERLDLLSDDALDVLRTRMPNRAEAALAAYDAMDERLAELATRIAAIRAELGGNSVACPIPTTVVCLDCGASAVVLSVRSWPIDRAMERTRLAERDLLRVEGAMNAAYAEIGAEPPHLDAIEEPDLHELWTMVRSGATAAQLRELLGLPKSETRLTREAMLALQRRG